MWTMVLRVVLFLVVCGIWCEVNAHPTRYSDISSNLTCADMPPPYSHHIHILFWQNNNDSVTGAFALRNEFMDHFGLSDENNTCNENNVWNTTHPPPFCMFTPDFPEPEGPFLTSDWAAFVPLEHFQPTVLWIMNHRGNYDVLVHPNSGCEINDHRDWPLWGGNKWELDVSIMHFNCPGCDQGDCVKMGANLMFQGDAYKCGLSNGTKSGSPFVLTNKQAFCTQDCQQWVNNIENIPNVCPRICDNFPGVDHPFCETHMHSLTELQQWQKYCAQFIN